MTQPNPLSYAGNDKGFTLIEFIAVILLLGILSAIATSRSNTLGDEAKVASAIEIVKNHLRYAQTKAMNSDVSWGINFAVSPYKLRRDTTDVNDTLPGDLPPGVSFTSSINPLMFENRWGSPGNTSITVTVSKGTSSRTFTVTKNTGFIQ
ncbi:MAG: prepilin-type N-terminal cleavage/methylation domain-containing protein [Desulfobulbaceae bacterium]|nr:prepilin-type N-terminal cleavage/methylation domain-containing protein [Desulfobulbaceae bacterium]